MFCPRCEKEMIWQNDYDLGIEEDDNTYTDFQCDCGVSVTVPWNRLDGEDDDKEGQ